MSKHNRREFLSQLGAASIILPELRAARFELGAERSPAASPSFQAAPSYDLLIAGGRVIDPSQKLSAERDVAISNGKIARVASDIPRAQARQVFEARGKLVTPGLINIHCHPYVHGIPSAWAPEDVGVPVGVTTLVDAGSTGARSFMGFRKYVIERSQTRIHALLNISTIGLVVLNELYLDPAMLDPQAAIKTIEENRDVILGIKIRIYGDERDVLHDIDALKKAREVSDATNLPIMMHWTNEPQLLALLKRGDILAHPYNPPPATPPPAHKDSNVIGGNGAKVLPQIVELKARGIWTQGDGATSHHAWEVSEKAASQGWFPDAIATDLGRGPGPETPLGMATRELPFVMSQYLHLGLSVDQVIERVTTNPGKMLKYPEKIGTLEVGTTADVSIFDLREGSFDVLDGRSQKRAVRQLFVPVATVKSGTLVKAAARS